MNTTRQDGGHELASRQQFINIRADHLDDRRHSSPGFHRTLLTDIRHYATSLARPAFACGDRAAFSSSFPDRISFRRVDHGARSQRDAERIAQFAERSYLWWARRSAGQGERSGRGRARTPAARLTSGRFVKTQSPEGR
ncbi:hypothetical protein EVAR_92110_1 [Eumeta japonica]|uniref:Uncharacterized protein n=1 Tax=Eumeta variegata TaxID=151549 RepID=A0A4C1SY94_EUMVA|nr:hypothetical protein EVAR_92110_1 [Eumeta japonica]